MTNQSTLDKLLEMRLPSMAEAFRTQMNDSRMKDVPFEDRFGMLVDIEYNNRRSNGLKRLIHNAGFDQPEAFVGDINYTSGRKLNKELIQRLASCEYITEHRNLFITGATGSGKTYLACAFGMSTGSQRNGSIPAPAKRTRFSLLEKRVPVRGESLENHIFSNCRIAAAHSASFCRADVAEAAGMQVSSITSRITALNRGLRSCVLFFAGTSAKRFYFRSR